MTRAKKNIILAKIHLNRLLRQCIMPIVKTIRYISLTTSQPDIAGELRSREARKVPYGTSHLSCSIRSFCALSTEG